MLTHQRNLRSLLETDPRPSPVMSLATPSAPTARSSEQPQTAVTATTQRLRSAVTALRLFGILLCLALASTFIAVVPVGHRGVLLRLGAVQNSILNEGVHVVAPAIYSIKPLSIRVQAHMQNSEAATKDLQDVKIDLAVQWHLKPDRVQKIYQKVGDIEDIRNTILEPAIENGLKTVVATLTAEQLISERASFREAIELLLRQRLETFDLELDGVDIVQLDFSKRFRAAVEAKQVAEQDARRAVFEALKAQRLATARIYQAEGEAKAQELLQNGLSKQVLQRQAIEKWNGNLPLVMSAENLSLLDLKSLLTADRERQKRR